MKTSPHKITAFSLVEVTIALGVAAFSLVAIFGMLPVGLKSNQAALCQTVANGILSEIAADLRSTLPTLPPGQQTASQQFAISIPASPVTGATPPTVLYFTSDGQFSTARTAQSAYLLTITFVPNGENARAASFAKLQVSWPVAAAQTNAAGSVQTIVALDRN